MGKLRGLKQQDKSNTPDSKDSNSKQLVEIEEVKGTPFAKVKEGKYWALVLGNYKLTPPMKKEDIEEEAKRMDWNRIMQVMHVMIEQHDKVREVFNQNNK